MNLCPDTGKRIYRTRRQALRKLDQIRSERQRGLAHRNEVAIYACPHGPHWHLTHWDQADGNLGRGRRHVEAPESAAVKVTA